MRQKCRFVQSWTYLWFSEKCQRFLLATVLSWHHSGFLWKFWGFTKVILLFGGFIFNTVSTLAAFSESGATANQTFCFCSHSWDGLKIWAHCWDVVWRTNCSCCGDETCDPAVAWQSRSVFHFKFQQSQNTTRVNCRQTYVQVISSALCGSGSQFFKWWISNFGDKFISSCVPLSCLTSSTASFWYPVSLQNKGFITAAVSFFFLNEIAELLTWRIVQTYTQRLKSIK